MHSRLWEILFLVPQEQILSFVTFVALSSQKHQNIPPVTALLMHPPGPSHCTMYCDVRLGCHSALALRQDEPLLSQSQGLRVCSSSCDPFGRPSSLYCAVQYSTVLHYSHTPEEHFSQSLEASFNFSNKIPERNGKLVIIVG